MSESSIIVFLPQTDGSGDRQARLIGWDIKEKQAFTFPDFCPFVPLGKGVFLFKWAVVKVNYFTSVRVFYHGD